MAKRTYGNDCSLPLVRFLKVYSWSPENDPHMYKYIEEEYISWLQVQIAGVKEVFSPSVFLTYKLHYKKILQNEFHLLPKNAEACIRWNSYSVGDFVGHKKNRWDALCEPRDHWCKNRYSLLVIIWPWVDKGSLDNHVFMSGYFKYIHNNPYANIILQFLVKSIMQWEIWSLLN